MRRELSTYYDLPMHTRAVSILSFLAVTFLLAQARAEVTSADLVGSWTGEMSMSMGKDNQKIPVKMDFSADGKLVVTTGTGAEKAEKVEKTTYSVTKGKVLLVDPDKKGNDVQLINVTVTKTKLTADMVMVDKPMPEGAKLGLTLDRKSAAPAK